MHKVFPAGGGCIISLMKTLRRNVKLFFGQHLLAEFLLIAPVMIPFFQLNRLGISSFYLAQSVFALTVLLAEVPSGYLADVIGRRKTLVLASFFYPAGLLVYAASSSLEGFLLAEFLLAVGVSLRSGSDSALLYDSLVSLGREPEYSRIEARGQQYSRFSTGLAAITGAGLAFFSMRLPFWINFIIFLPLIPLALALLEPERVCRPRGNAMRGILQICLASLKNRTLRPYLLYFSLLGAVSIIALWAYFLILQQAGLPLWFYGLFFTLFQFSGAWGARLAVKSSSLFGGSMTVACSLALVPILLLAGVFPSAWMIPLVLLHPLLWNLAIPLLLEQINRRTSSDTRATVLSLASMGRSLAYALTAPFFGLAAEKAPLSGAFIGLALLFLLAGLPLLRQIKNNWAE